MFSSPTPFVFHVPGILSLSSERHDKESKSRMMYGNIKEGAGMPLPSEIPVHLKPAAVDTK